MSKHHLRVETRLNIDEKEENGILEKFIRFLYINNRNIKTSYSLNEEKRNGEFMFG